MSGGTGMTAPARRSVYDYGAQPGATLDANGNITGGFDNTSAFNAYFAACRDAMEEWFIPAGDWRINGAVSIFTGGRCEGNILMPNNGSIRNRLVVRPVAADLIDKDQTGGLTLATVKSWTGCYRRSRKINGLTGRMGQYIFVNTVDQDMIKRSGQPWDFEEGFLVADNEGRLAHSLYADWNTAAWTQSGTALKVQIVRERISIAGLTVILFNDGSGQPTASTPNATEAAVTVTRCNTDFVDCSVINRSGQQVFIGFSAMNACSVTYHSCYVQGLQIWKTNYGFSSGGCAGVSYVNCSEVFTRRGIDATKCKNISIVGGTFPSGVGAHWAWWMSVTGANLGGTNGVKSSTTGGTDANASAVWVAGGGYTVENCTIHLSDLGSAAVAMRSDLHELGDSVIIRGNTIVFADAPGTSAIFSTVGNPSGFDAGRPVEMPRLVVISDNTVTAYGTDRIVQPYAAHDGSWTRTNTPYDIKVSQRLEIRNNQWSFLTNANEPLTDRLSDNVTSRIQLVYYKPAMLVGSGVEADLSGFPSLRVLVFAMPESDATVRASARFNARIEQVSGRLEIRRGPGAYRSITYDVSDVVVANANSGVPSYPVVGDETINSVDLSRLVVDAETASGTSTVLQPNGPETNLDLHLKAKGTGLVRFGTRTGTGDAAINGYVSVKDSTGNVVKLATVA